LLTDLEKENKYSKILFHEEFGNNTGGNTMWTVNLYISTESSKTQCLCFVATWKIPKRRGRRGIRGDPREAAAVGTVESENLLL
jgi:hypothetical protein